MIALAGGWSTPVARADGDPASDVLASQPLFLPQDAGVPAGQQAQLVALLAMARRSGYPIRVAVIASAADLGSVTELWHQPQNYARFLGEELSLVGNSPLLVVMPNGYGVSGLRGAENALLDHAPAPGADLRTAAITAIERLAAASGHRLSLPRTVGPSSSNANDTWSWLAFAIGGVLIAGAWTASLRARPLRTRAPKTTPG